MESVRTRDLSLSCRHSSRIMHLLECMFILEHCTVWDRYMQVLYLGRAPRTKETLPNFREKCRVTRHSRAFCGLTGSQRTPGIGVSQLGIRA